MVKNTLLCCLSCLEMSNFSNDSIKKIDSLLWRMMFTAHRPLSRRLDRCDRVIQKESGDPNGGNMCSFSWATGTSRVRHNADYVPCAQIRFDL